MTSIRFPTGVLAALCALLLFLAPDAVHAQTGTIAGSIRTPDGVTAEGATVRIVTLGREVTAGADGSFAFANVTPGSYVLEVLSPQFGGALQRAVVRAGETTTVEIQVSPLYHQEALVVSVGPEARSSSELYQAASVVSGRELALRAEATLGETLAGEPGVTSTYFGPGSSRPLIRGLGGDRIRVLEGGVGVGDASSTSPDHAVSVEAGAARQVEVVRGPATLLYGSSAIGGVVNVVDDRIPTAIGSRTLRGYGQILGASISNEVTGAAELSGHVGSLAWNLSGLRRDTDDVGVPGFADADGEGEPGILENSAVETLRGSVGLSWVGDRGHIGASVSGFDTNYGVPGHGHGEEGEEEEEEEEESVTIELDQRRVDAEGSLRIGTGAIQHVESRWGWSNYEHVELEGAEIGTRFLNDEWEGRVEAHHAEFSGISGAVGVQVGSRDFEAIGDEAFIAPTTTTQLGVFLFEELETEDALRLQFGARLERRASDNSGTGLEVSNTGVSLSTGVNWPVTERVVLALSAGRSVKSPGPEELFSDGPHLATQSYEIGDPTLSTEVALSVDATVRLVSGPVQGSLTGYVNSFSDFIYQRLTGAELDGLPVRQFTQADARFLGFELAGEAELLEDGRNHLALLFGADYVRATLTDTDEPLPLIPPLSTSLGLAYDGGPLRADVEVRNVSEQDRVAPEETVTDGYTLLDASVSYRLVRGPLSHDLTLRGSNLTDTQARPHTSLLKDLSPLPGRGVRLLYRISF